MMEKINLTKDAELVSPQSVSSSSETTTVPYVKREGAVSMKLAIPVIVVAVVAGVGTGYLLSKKFALPTQSATQNASSTTTTSANTVKVGDTFGSKDSSTFKDSATGVLLPGGVNGEGSYHLVREGGESQNVYLTSSVIDLGMFVNHKVDVRGETFKAQHAGWLMDVGQLKVLELNATLPDWAQKAMEKQEKGAINQ